MVLRTLSWFSCGATSAVATKLAIKKYGDVEIVYIDTHSEHPDNKRFLADCERWLGKGITVLSSDKYTDIWDVFEKDRYLVGVAGARCSMVLKKWVRQDYEDLEKDIQVFGFDVGEKKRAERFTENNPLMNTEFPLIDNGIGKEESLAILVSAGIRLPKMYALGYHNNNCVGCVKGQAGYWNKIRKDFPQIFQRMSKVERELDVAINKRYEDGQRIRVFLDELPQTMGRHTGELAIQCGLFCGEV